MQDRRFKVAIASVVLAVGTFLASAAFAQVLTFEGLKDTEAVANFYNGGLGGSGSGPQPGPDGVGDWRCLAVEKLSQVALTTGAWRTQARARPQRCIEQIDFDFDVDA